MSKHIFVSVFIVSISLLFSGCWNQNPTETNPTNTQPEEFNNNTTIDNILSGNKLVALAQNNSILLVDPEYAQPFEVYQLKSDETPPRLQDIDTFKVSPDKKHIVWYNPQSGIIALNIKNKTTQIVQTANDWLNTNPYFQFNTQNSELYFITDNGKTLNQVDLNNQTNKYLIMES